MGIILVMLAIFMSLPVMVLSWFYVENWPPFVLSACITLLVGVVLTYTFRGENLYLNTKQLFLITFCCWFGVSIFSTLPFIFCSQHFSITDAVFESVSGVTTTGSTVLTDIDHMPRDILLWRSMLQWLGGIGIIGMAIAVLPFLHVGGMRLFKTESSDWSEKSHPRAKDATMALLRVYILLSVLCALAYFFAGMSPFDAINHAMTTISTGGYSTHDASIGYFHSDLVHWVSVFFMAISSLPFLILARFLIEFDFRAFRDQQVIGFAFTLISLSIVLSVYLYGHHDFALSESLKMAFFNVTSIISTTGYVSADYGTWGPEAVVLFFFITFIGGCSGSTSGGMKIFRFQLSYLLLKGQLIRSIHPRAVITKYYNNRIVGDEIITSAVAFTYLFLCTFALLSLLLALHGFDFITSISAAATVLSNVGPGLGDIIGPSGNFSPLHDNTKWILSLGMLLGRLELLTVYAIFSWHFWNN
jgi:trk system potassium uptake protein TrkH